MMVGDVSNIYRYMDMGLVSISLWVLDEMRTGITSDLLV